MKQHTILNFCAHNDDQIIGAGGTLAKYAQEGKKIITIVFSYGAMSHPWIKKKEITKTRIKESSKAANIIGEDQVIYLGLRENHFLCDAKEMNLQDKIKSLIKSYNPKKIFTHSPEDPHPDHRAVFKILTKAVKDLKKTPPIFSFNIWNPITIKNTNSIRLIVDITKTFPKKLKAIKSHKSQKLPMYCLITGVFIKSFLNGLDHGCIFAEVFYKVS